MGRGGASKVALFPFQREGLQGCVAGAGGAELGAGGFEFVDQDTGECHQDDHDGDVKELMVGKDA